MYKDLSLKEKAKILLYGGKLGLTSVEDIAKLYDEAIGSRVILDNNGYYAHSKKNDMLIEGDSTGTNITTQGIPFKIAAWDNLGNYQELEPNGEYYFPGSMVREHALQAGGLAKPFSYEDIPDVRYLGGGLLDKWREINRARQSELLEYYNTLPIVNDVPVALPEVTVTSTPLESQSQKEYNELRNTLLSNPFAMASAVLDPFMSTVLANKNQNDLMEAALNLENIYDKMLQATMVSSLGKSLLFGSIPEKVSTVGSLFGAYGADKAQSKIIQKASDNKYSSWENILLDFGVPNSIGMFINPAYWVGGKYGGKYANHVGRNATEAVLRLGDVALNPQRGALVLAKDPNFYKFVFGNNPDLAYKVGMQYSGEEAVIDYPDINQSDIAKAHPGDQIDVYFGKSKSRFPEVGRDRVSKEMNKYIDENYSGRDIKVYDMGDIESPYKTDRNGLIEYSVDMSSKYQNTPSVQRYNSVTGEYDRLLDPGNFHVQSRELIPDQMYKQSNEDLFKWNPKDYWGPRKSLTPKGLLNKALTNTGLRAINEYGTPFVSLWNDIVYNKDFMTNGGLYTTPNYSNGGNLFKKGGIYIKPEKYILQGKKYFLGGKVIEGEFDVEDISKEEINELNKLGFEIEVL